MRPHALGLVDSYLHNDNAVAILGKYDGNVYESLYEAAKN